MPVNSGETGGTDSSNIDYQAERIRMVRQQLADRDITDERVLEAFRRVPRHSFVTPDARHQAYEDHPIAIGNDQTISQPYMVAIMTQCLAIGGWENVLEIGTGSGYQTAILAEITQTVYTIERFKGLSQGAGKALTDLGYTNIIYGVGDGTLGWLDHSPFDRIIVTAGAPSVPEPLRNQLADGGLLVIPVGPAESQKLMVVSRDGDSFEENEICSCKFVKLIGQEGWPVSPPEHGGNGAQ